MLMIGTTRLAQEVHAAWREGMLAQGREVAPERMSWETLSDQDKLLDRYIGIQLAKLITDAMGAESTPDEPIEQHGRLIQPGVRLTW